MCGPTIILLLQFLYLIEDYFDSVNTSYKNRSTLLHKNTVGENTLMKRKKLNAKIMILL